MDAEAKAHAALGDRLRAGIAARLGVSPTEISCPRQRSIMTPCVAAHGGSALLDDGSCVGCKRTVQSLLAAETAAE